MADFNILVDAIVDTSTIHKSLDKAKDLQIKVNIDANSFKKSKIQKSLDTIKGLSVSVEKVKLTKTAIQNGIKTSLSKVKSGLSVNIDNPKVNIKKIQKQLTDAKFVLKIDTDTDIVTKVTKKLQKDTNSNNKEYKETASQIQRLNKEFKTLDTTYTKASKLQKTGKSNNELDEYIKNTENSFQTLRQLQTEIESFYNPDTGLYTNTIDEKTLSSEKINQYSESIKTLKNSLEGIETVFQNIQTQDWEFTGTKRVQSQITSTDTMLTKAQKLMSEWGQTLKWNDSDTYNELQNDIKTFTNGKKTGDVFDSQQILKFKDTIVKAEGAVYALDKNTNTLGNRLNSIFKGRFSNIVSSMGIAYAIQLFKQLEENVVQINASMAQLELVTGTTGQGLENMFDSACQSAKKLGTSITDILSSTETFARLGYSANDSSHLAEVTGMMANVGDMTTEEATTGMTAILKAFNVPVNEAENIGDVLTNVGKKYAISASELAEALESSGSALEAANNDFNQSVAILTAGNAAVQDASKVGTAIKTTSLRIRGASADLEDMGEEVDELITSTPKLRKEIKGLSGVDIMVDENTFKSTYQILLEIAQVWNKLSDTSQATLLEDLAGKHNANVLKSVITNVQDLSGAYQDAQNSAGNLVADNEIVMNTAQKQLAQITVAFEEFSKSSLSVSVVTVFAEIIEGLIVILTNLGEVFGSITTVIAGLGLISAINTFRKFKNEVKYSTTAIGSMIKFIQQMKVVSEDGISGITRLSTAFKSLSIAEKTSVILTVASAVLAIGTAIYNVVSNINEEQQQAIEKVKELRTQYEETINSTTQAKSNIQTVEDSGLEEEFNRLKKGVTSTGDNLTLTNDQFERYKEICEEIVGYCPDLQEGYDSATGALSGQNNVLQKAIELLEKKQRLEAKELVSSDNFETAYEEAEDGYEDAKNKLYDHNFANLTTKINGTLYNNQGVNRITTKLGELGERANYKSFAELLGFKTDYNDYINNGIYDVEAFNKALIDNYDNVIVTLEQMSKNKTLTFEGVEYSIDTQAWEQLIKDVQKYQETVAGAESDFDEANNSFKESTLQYVAQSSVGWYDLDNNVQNIVSQWISDNDNFTVENLDTEEKRQEAKDQILQMVQSLIGDEDIQENVNKLLELDSSKLNIQQYAKQYDKLLSQISKSTGIDKKSIQVALQLDEVSISTVKNQTKKIQAQLTKSNKKEIKKYLNSLSAYDFTKIMEVMNSETGEAITSLKELKQSLQNVKNEASLDNIPSLTAINESIDNLQSAYSSAKTVVREYVEYGQISMDNLQNLLSLDDKYIDMLVDKEGKINLNTEAYKRLVQAEMEEQKASLIKSTAEAIDNINSKSQAQTILADNTENLTKKEYDLAEAYLTEALASAKARDIKAGDTDFTIYKAALSEVESLTKKLSLVDNAYQGMIKNIDYGMTGSTDTTNSATQALEKYVTKLERQKQGLEQINNIYQDNIDTIQKKVDILDKEIDALEREKEALNDEKDELNNRKDDLEEAKDAIVDIVELADDYVKDQLQQEIDAYDKQKDKLQDKKDKIDDIIDAQKKSLEQEKDAEKWRQTIQEKNNALSEAQAKANAFTFDNSSEGKANLKTAQKDVQQAKNDRDEELTEHKYDVRIDGLDNYKDKVDSSYDKQIDNLDKLKEKVQDQANDEVYIRKQSYKMIDGYSKKTYNQLSKYAKSHTTKSTVEFQRMWKLAKQADDKYNVSNKTTGELLNQLDKRIFKIDDKIKDIDKEITSIERGIKKLKKKSQSLTDEIQEWKYKQDAVSRQQTVINRKIDKAKNKIEDLNEQLKHTVGSTGAIADNGKRYNDYIQSATKELKKHGYKVTFNGTTFKTSESNKDKALNILYKKVHKRFANEGIYVDKNYIRQQMKEYASGTKSSQGNIVIKDEEGYEFTLANTSEGHYANVPENSIIFNKQSTDVLWDFANQPNKFFEQQFAQYMSKDRLTNFANNSQLLQKIANTPTPVSVMHEPQQNITNDNSISMPITIQGNADKTTVKSFKEEVIKSLIKVNSSRYK